MSTLAPPVTRERETATLDYCSPAAETSRLSAYLELAKGRIALMVLLATGVGYLLGSGGVWQLAGFLHASLGILLAVVASSALNQYLERHTDAYMLRTSTRPLPSNRLSAVEVLLFGLACGVVSVAYLAVMVNLLTAAMTLLTIVMYAAVYTPLKRYTTLCTAIGAIPGALPPVLGWTASGAPLDWGAFSLFAILFVWQFPHFLAIAWIYKDQYDAAGLKMVPGRGRPGVLSAVSTGYALALIPISLLPCRLGLAGNVYGAVAVVLGLLYLGSSVLFQGDETRRGARRVLWVSLMYLPLVLLTLTWDHLRLLN
ncbi:heme o synthase [Planctomicrobium sp. SH664]|uniref:heme o synthase n=1 Tax=Planctomicrobium sp. SH664 TaxID=3448125 RepID=UPI003F5C68EB